MIAVGRRTRVCRGCALAWAGLALGFGAGTAVALPLTAGLALAAAGAAALGASFFLRLPKSLGRGAPALALGAALACGWAPALAAGVLLAGGWLAYRRKGPDRSRCATCPQREAKVCDGLKPLVRRERAVMRLGGARVARALAAQQPAHGVRAG